MSRRTVAPLPRPPPAPGVYPGEGTPTVLLETASLVTALQEGSGSAWKSVLLSHGPMMLGLAREVVADEGAAWQCIEDAFIALYRRIAGFAHVPSFDYWMYQLITEVVESRAGATEALPCYAAVYRGHAEHAMPEEKVEAILALLREG